MKATHSIVDGGSFNIFKDPLTDSGEKKSATGRIIVDKDSSGKFKLIENCELIESGGYLEPVFHDGVLLVDQKLSEIRKRVAE
jgi:nicotinamide phosphoribosyltransferase